MNLISMLLVAVYCSFKKCRYMNYKNGATVYVGWVQCFLMAKYSCSRNQKWSYNITGWMTRMVKLGPNLDTASDIDQKGHFFEKKKKKRDTKNFTTTIQSLYRVISIKIKLCIIFTKGGQHPIAGHIRGLD